MERWPNWVDLIVVIVILRASYNGFGRGFVAELLSLIGAVTITAVTINYWSTVRTWVSPWLAFSPEITAPMVFWVLFLTLILVMHIMLRRVADLVKWERVHWLLQSSGLFLGGLRGIWWACFILLVLASSGIPQVRESVEERSVFGSQMMKVARPNLERVIDRFPGAQQRGDVLIPPLKSAGS